MGSCFGGFFFFKQKTAYEITRRDWSSDVCSSDLRDVLRLYKRMVYDLQIAQDVSAFESSSWLGSEFIIIATARSGHTLDELAGVIDEEIKKLADQPPTAREVQRAVNQYEAGFLDRLERIGGFGGKADQLNQYSLRTGDPDYFDEDLARYRAIDSSDVQSAVITSLKPAARVVLSV